MPSESNGSALRIPESIQLFVRIYIRAAEFVVNKSLKNKEERSPKVGFMRVGVFLPMKSYPIENCRTVGRTRMRRLVCIPEAYALGPHEKPKYQLQYHDAGEP